MKPLVHYQLLNGRGRVVIEGPHFRIQSRPRGMRRAWYDLGITSRAEQACQWTSHHLSALEPALHPRKRFRACHY